MAPATEPSFFLLGLGGTCAVQSSQLAPRTILVVEDEPLVALEIVDTLTARGAHVVSATRVADAIKSIDQNQISAAVLDIKLGNTDCAAICLYLRERGIPFLFHTAYSATLDGFNSVPMIPKPSSPQAISDAVKRLCGSHQQVG
jgi:DNA-binding response OmpR family regulator